MLPKIELNKKRVGSLVGDVEALVADIGHKTVGNIFQRQNNIKTERSKNQDKIRRAVKKASLTMPGQDYLVKEELDVADINIKTFSERGNGLKESQLVEKKTEQGVNLIELK